MPALCLTGLTGVACSETIYDFFPPEGSSDGTGGDCTSDSCGSASGGATGGDSGTDSSTTEGGSTSETSATTAETTGYAGDPNTDEPLDSCTSVTIEGEPLQMLRFTQSGNCIGRGVATILGGQAGYLVTTQPCTQRPRDAWVVLDEPGGVMTFRNESVGMNLDVRFAAPTGGTPLVLFLPHPAYNQRFGKVIENETDFQLAPQHAVTMCLTEVGGGVEIWPCNAAALAQHIELVACEDIEP